MTTDASLNLLRADELPLGTAIDLGEYPLTREEIIEFASKWDPLPMHTDEEAAARTYHGKLIASGLHSMAILHRLSVLGAYQRWNVVAGREVEMNLVRPVVAGMTLRGSVTVTSVVPAPTGRWVVRHEGSLFGDGELVVRTKQVSIVVGPTSAAVPVGQDDRASVVDRLAGSARDRDDLS